MLACSRAGTYAIPSCRNTRRRSTRSGTRAQATCNAASVRRTRERDPARRPCRTSPPQTALRAAATRPAAPCAAASSPPQTPARRQLAPASHAHHTHRLPPKCERADKRVALAAVIRLEAHAEQRRLRLHKPVAEVLPGQAIINVRMRRAGPVLTSGRTRGAAQSGSRGPCGAPRRGRRTSRCCCSTGGTSCTAAL